MYEYRAATALSRAPESQWENYDFENKVLKDLYNDYIEFYITAFDSVVDGNIYIDMPAYRNVFETSTQTVAEWLLFMDGTPVETIEVLPGDTLTSARYANAVLHGYKIELAKAGYPYPENMPTTELTDLSLYRPVFTTNMELVHKYCLASVNGYYHRTGYASDRAYILDGGVTAAMNRCSHTGLLSFLDIGEIKEVQLKDTDIIPLTEGHPLSEGIIIRTEEDITNKSVMFILGGYLIRPEKDVFFKNSDNTWVLNILGLPYYERIIESSKGIDLSSMEIEHLDTNPDDAFVKESLLTDKALRAYLQLSQTFLVIVDTPELYYSKINVRVSNIPGLITAYQEPTYTLIMGYGKSIEYSLIQEENYWALRVADAWYVQYAWQTAPVQVTPVLTNQYSTWKPYLRTQGYFLDIKGKKKDA